MVRAVLFPIGHNRLIYGRPYVTIAIIAICTLIQFYSEFSGAEDELMELAAEADYSLEYSDPDALAELEERAEALFKKIPALRWGYETGTGLTANALWSAFVHAGWLHLIGNMIFLWLAGSLLEDRWGRWRYLAFYGAGAIASTLVFNAFYDGPATLLVGASGAVSASLGAFLVLFHRAKIKIFYWFFFRIVGTFEMAAYLALPLWFANQVFWAYMQSEGMATGVAYTAHIGGFVFGAVVAFAASRFFPQIHDHQLDSALPKAIATQVGNYTGEAKDPAQAPETEDELRHQRCLEALEQGDMVGFSETASRVVLDLAKQHRYEDIFRVYQSANNATQNLPFTDGAFSEIAAAADRHGSGTEYVQIATQLLATHPGSRFIPGILWRVAEVQRESGRQDLSEATLKRIIAEHPEHYYATKAQEALA